MKVRLTTDRCGPGLEQWDGETHDFPEDEALALVAANQAELIEPAESLKIPAAKPAAKRKGDKR